MSFIQFFRILWARRAIILIATLSCFVAAILVAKILPPRYEAKSRVMLDIVKPDPVTGEVIASQFARAFVKTQTELIRDYRVAGKVVDAFGWTSSPILAAQYAERPSDDNREFRRWLAQRIIDRTSAKLIEGSNILEITFSSTSPEAARKGADTLRQAYIDQTLAFRREGAAKNAQWFKQQADKIRIDLTRAEGEKADFERENGIILQDDNTDTEMAKLKALAATAPAAQMAAVPMTSPSTMQLAQIDAQIAAASQTLGPNHPQFQNMQRQRAAIAQAASQELAAARAAARGAAGGPSISSLMSAQTKKILAQRGKVNEAQRLATDVAILRDQFLKTSSRAAELEQEAQSIQTGLTLLGNAVAPEDPVFPKMPLIIFGSLAFGIGLGILTSLVVELLSRRIRGVEDLTIAGVPVIGAMSRRKSEDGRSNTLWSWLGFNELFSKRAPE